MRNYLLYLVKTKWLQTIIMAIIPTIIFVSFILLDYNPSYVPSTYRYPSVFTYSYVFIIIIIPVVAIFRLSIFRNSRDVDLYYSLPLSRKNLLLTQLLFGLLQILFVWTLMYMVGLVTLTILTNGYFMISLLLLAYLVVIGYILIIYLITSFFFLRANTIVDGIAFIVILNTLYAFIFGFLTHGYFSDLGFTASGMFTPYYSLGNIFKHLIYYSKPNPNTPILGLYEGNIGATIFNTLLFLVLAIFCFLYTYKSIDHEKTENIGRLSLSKFGYISLIPLNLLFSTASVYFGFSSFSMVAICILASAGFIGYFIMRRSARLQMMDIISIVAPIMLGIIIMVFIRY